MKVSLHVRIGKGRNGLKVAASLRPNPAPLTEIHHNSEKILPTVSVELKLDLPDRMFAVSRAVIEAQIPDDMISIPVEIVPPRG